MALNTTNCYWKNASIIEGIYDCRRYQTILHEQTLPFGDVPICYKLNNKIFAQLYPYEHDYKITLKCTADVGDFYRMIYPGKVVRGYHCTPVQQPYWNTIYLNDFPEDELYHLIDLAYDTVLNSFSKKVQREILSSEK